MVIVFTVNVFELLLPIDIFLWYIWPYWYGFLREAGLMLIGFSRDIIFRFNTILSFFPIAFDQARTSFHLEHIYLPFASAEDDKNLQTAEYWVAVIDVSLNHLSTNTVPGQLLVRPQRLFDTDSLTIDQEFSVYPEEAESTSDGST